MSSAQVPSVSESISFGWKIFKANAAIFLLLEIGFFAIYVIFAGMFESFAKESMGVSIVGNLAINLFWLIFGAGVTRWLLKFIDTDKATIKQFDFPIHLTIKLFVAGLLKNIVAFLTAAIAFIPLVVAVAVFFLSEYSELNLPMAEYLKNASSSVVIALLVTSVLWFVLALGLSIWISARLAFAETLVADKEIGGVEALKESSAITQGKVWKLINFSLALGFFNLFGLILIGVGLLVTIPVSMLAYAYLYRQLSPQKITA